MRDVFERYMDAYQTVLALKVGDVLTKEQLADIRFCDEYERDDQENQINVFQEGFQRGMETAGGTDLAKAIDERDASRSAEIVHRQLSRHSSYFGFIRGARACREMMARFVEQGGYATMAASIRANWHPGWGEDPGAPEGDIATPERPPAREEVT